jgi:hypothetical protein
MNALKYRVFRYFAIATLFVIGVATTIATGGGSSGGMPGVGPPAATGPSLAITSANGEEVASAVIIAIGTSFDLGDISGDDIAVQAAEGPVAAPGSLSSANVYAKFLPAYAMAAENCANGGTVEVTATVADPTTPTVGDRLIAVFDNCDDNEGYVISGTVDLTIAAIQGDVLTDVFLLGLDVVLTDIVMIDGTETITASGQFMLTLDNLDFPVLALSLAGDQLQFGAAGQAITLTNFDHSLQVDTGVIPETKLAEVFGRLDSQSLGGTVDYETPILVQAIGDFDPHSGRILVTGANDSSVLINIFDSTRITLEIDTNGDGVIDEYVDTTWAALSGQSASTNSRSRGIQCGDGIRLIDGNSRHEVRAACSVRTTRVARCFRRLRAYGSRLQYERHSDRIRVQSHNKYLQRKRSANHDFRCLRAWRRGTQRRNEFYGKQLRSTPRRRLRRDRNSQRDRSP